MTPAELERWLRVRQAEVGQALARLCTAGGAPGRLGEAAAYVLEGGGKRLRPVLVLAAFDACEPAPCSGGRWRKRTRDR